jgi:PAS domain-containing protein
MTMRDDEDEPLRSVATQNAKSILLARQGSERELIRAKEALEAKTRELAHSVSMLRATLESATDGIIVTDGEGRVTDFNEKFVKCGTSPRHHGFPRPCGVARIHLSSFQRFKTVRGAAQ